MPSKYDEFRESDIEQILQAINAADTEQELACILHASPNWHFQKEANIKLFYQSVDKQRILLDEQRRIANMTLDERCRYIAAYSKYPAQSSLVRFARDIQSGVEAGIVHDDPNLGLIDFKIKYQQIAVYLHKHILDKDTHYAIRIELSHRLHELICTAEFKIDNSILNNHDLNQEQKINLLTNRITSFKKDNMVAKKDYGYFSEYVSTFRKCHEHTFQTLRLVQSSDTNNHAQIFSLYKSKLHANDTAVINALHPKLRPKI